MHPVINNLKINKMTAIEWLEMEIVKLETKYAIPSKIYELCEQAKEMEKKQIIDAYEDGTYHNTFGNENYETSEDYYNQIFNKK